MIVDEYQPLNSFVAAGSLATGIPACQVPRPLERASSTSRTRSRPTRCSPATSAAATSSRSTSQCSANWAPASSCRRATSARVRSARPLTYFELNAGLIPGAGANGRPLFLKYGVNVNRELLHSDGDQPLRRVADQPHEALLARPVPDDVVHVVEGHRHQRRQQRQRPAVLRPEPVLEEQGRRRFRPHACVHDGRQLGVAVRQGKADADQRRRRRRSPAGGS